MKNTADMVKRGEWKAALQEMKTQARLGMAMVKNRRMHLGVEKVRGLSEVKDIYKKAKGKK
jgi:hypothetical protein